MGGEAGRRARLVGQSAEHLEHGAAGHGQGGVAAEVRRGAAGGGHELADHVGDGGGVATDVDGSAGVAFAGRDHVGAYDALQGGARGEDRGRQARGPARRRGIDCWSRGKKINKLKTACTSEVSGI